MTRRRQKAALFLIAAVAALTVPMWTLERLAYVAGAVVLLAGSYAVGRAVGRVGTMPPLRPRGRR